MKIVSRGDWFESRPCPHGVTRFWEPWVDPLFRANFWFVEGREGGLLIDSGMGLCLLRDSIPALRREGIAAVATHTHLDHMGGMHEFETRLVHPLEANTLATGLRPISMRTADWPPAVVAAIRRGGYPIGEELLTGVPSPDFDLARVAAKPAPHTRLVEEGDTVALDDRVFTVLHLPGHSPGSIGLYESATGILFSGDAIYDGPLLDDLPGCSVEDYRRTMERLRMLDVSIVHAGHDESFGKARLVQLAESYLRKRE